VDRSNRSAEPQLAAASNASSGSSRAPTVLNETGFTCEVSLNAKNGRNTDEFIDLKNEVIHSKTDYAAKYCDGFKRHLSDETG
jgi:hypothetical protein